MKEPIHIKSLYERFMEEYTAIEVPANNKRGFKVKYVYYGTWYRWDLPEDILKKEKRRIIVDCILGETATIVAACIKSWINTMLLVAIPAILGLLTCFILAINVGRFFFSKNPTSRSNYRSISNGLTVFPILCSILSGLTWLACMGYMLFLRIMDPMVVVISFLHMTNAVLSTIIGKIYRSIPFITEKNDTLGKVKRLSPNI